MKKKKTYSTSVVGICHTCGKHFEDYTKRRIDIGETPWTYDWDAEAQAGYIKLSNHAIDSTVPLTDSVKLDQDVDGDVVGIEILDAGESGAHETTRKRMVENPKEFWKVGDWEETGESEDYRRGYERALRDVEFEVVKTQPLIQASFIKQIINTFRSYLRRGDE